MCEELIPTELFMKMVVETVNSERLTDTAFRRYIADIVQGVAGAKEHAKSIK